jgi:hypothetical protein
MAQGTAMGGKGAPLKSFNDALQGVFSSRMEQSAAMGGKGPRFDFVNDALQNGVSPSIVTNAFAYWLAQENAARAGGTSENADIQVVNTMTDKEVAHLAELQAKIDELEALLLQAEGENGIDESPYDDIAKYY